MRPKRTVAVRIAILATAVVALVAVDVVPRFRSMDRGDLYVIVAAVGVAWGLLLRKAWVIAHRVDAPEPDATSSRDP